MALNYCYMCGAAATSVEHVPPRCLFPEQKDLAPGIDLRKQLLTVPSCDVHNTIKSKDDEYLLYVLLINVPNNQTATNHVFTKMVRAIQHNSSAIASLLTNTQLPVLVEDTAAGELHQTIAVQVDLSRLNTSLEMIGRALFFHHFKVRWHGAVLVHPHFILAFTEPDARELNRPTEEMSKAVEQLMLNEPQHGENQEVFCYQVAAGEAPTKTIMYLRFYEGSRVTLLFRDSS